MITISYFPMYDTWSTISINAVGFNMFVSFIIHYVVSNELVACKICLDIIASISVNVNGFGLLSTWWMLI